jgi:hypothetical protein
MPSLDGGVVGNLECIVDACINGCETGAFGVYHQHVVVLAVCERRVDGSLFHPCQRDGRIRHNPWVVGVDGPYVYHVWPGTLG